MQSFLTDAGYWAVIVFAFVQACCIPISSEITFGFAGVLAYQGHLSLAGVIILGTLAEVAGSSTAYGLGRLGGRHTVERYRKYLLMTRRDVERAERFFAGRGAWSVAVARAIPLVRAFAGLVAGFLEVPLLPFEIFNVIGTAVWVTVLSVVGYELGSDWTKVSKNVSHTTDALALLAVLALVALIAYKAWELRKERRADAHGSGGHAPDGDSSADGGSSADGAGGAQNGRGRGAPAKARHRAS
jgi:membrane protein DedA with SNARE-associated domain